MSVGHSPPGTPGSSARIAYDMTTVIRKPPATLTPQEAISDPNSLLSQHISDDVISRQNLKRMRKENESIEVPVYVLENLVADVKYLKKSLTATNNFLKTLSEQNEFLKAELSMIKTNVQVNASANIHTTYAEKLKSIDPLVVIIPKNKDQTSSATKNEIKNKISPTKIVIKKLRKSAKGGITIECENKLSQENLQVSAIEKLGENYDVNIPTLFNPRFKIVDVSIKHSEAEIKSLIFKQNDHVNSNSNIKLITVIEKPKIKPTHYTYIFETDPKTYSAIINNGKLSIGWDRCRVFENIYISRCFKCLGFNHKAVDCTKSKVCLKCAENHDVKECTSTKTECVNCKWAVENLKLKLKTDHQANSLECSVLQRRVDQSRQRILVDT